jgi:DNA-binding NtrC family response regulator
VSRSLADFCAARDWKATTARTADDALLAIDAADAGDHPVDIVLSDVSLPGMDGFELLGRLTRERKGVAVILMTGYGSIDSAVAALRSGAADYLTRPIVEDELLQAVARAMRQRSLLR